jgi:hypothetical protein
MANLQSGAVIELLKTLRGYRRSVGSRATIPPTPKHDANWFRALKFFGAVTGTIFALKKGTVEVKLMFREMSRL